VRTNTSLSYLQLAYSGALYSFILAPQYHEPIDTIEQGVNYDLPVQSLGELAKHRLF